MRKQDLRKFDINLMIGILGVFCLISLVFILLWWGNFINVNSLNIKMMLWSSYLIVFIITLLVYIFTRKPHIVWEKSKTESLIKKKSKYKVDMGQSYILKSNKKNSRNVFKDLIKSGRNGMIISRTKPSILKHKLKSKNQFVLWLTEAKVENAINPLEIEELMYTIKKYIKNNKKAIIMIEGIEYLINFLPFKKVLHLIQDLRDEVVLQEANFFLRINPGLLKTQHLSLIEKEFVRLEKNV